MTVFKASQMVALHNTPEHREIETNMNKAESIQNVNDPCSFPPFTTASNLLRGIQTAFLKAQFILNGCYETWVWSYSSRDQESQSSLYFHASICVVSIFPQCSAKEPRLSFLYHPTLDNFLLHRQFLLFELPSLIAAVLQMLFISKVRPGKM